MTATRFSPEATSADSAVGVVVLVEPTKVRSVAKITISVTFNTMTVSIIARQLTSNSCIKENAINNEHNDLVYYLLRQLITDTYLDLAGT